MDKAIFLKRLGVRIATVREQQGLTQSELARKCDKDRQSINRLEKGRVNASIYYLQQIALELEVSLSQLLDLDLDE